MKRILLFAASLLFLFHLLPVQAQKSYSYESVPGDKLGVRIYTLDNGMKVYMSVNNEEPRITAYVAVRVGGKHDPAETTGLAHYFEHMMFKGTPNFGTADWEKEKILIDDIEALFEVYRIETDETKRAELYKQIDSISYEASKLAIPNEYDKLMKLIGSQGTNAATSLDYTFYIENIPSNQIENWSIIQADRFTHPVLRLFHTELETVYEEKNMSLTNDGRKTIETLFASLYPNHPYGQQTVLGHAEHLKNPSMTNINRFFDKWYIPDNMAVILAGDFDPESAIAIIDKHFGTLKQKPLTEFNFQPESPITAPLIKEVKGLEAENLLIAFRFPGIDSDDALYVNMMAMMLYNGKAGLIDLNINQKQKALEAAAFPYMLGDYSALVLSGKPKDGQTLEELRDLLLEQVDLLKKGSWPDWMLNAAINNLKLREMKQAESNSSRARMMMNSFIYEIPWKNQVNYIERIGKLTKNDILSYAGKHLLNNYVVIYKRQADPEDLPKVSKPPITPIFLNRDAESEFLTRIRNNKVEPIKPVFVDFSKDLTRDKTKTGQEVFYVKNTENNTFNLYFYYNMGRWNDKLLSLAVSYLPYLGTSIMTAEQIQQEFYKLACTFSVNTGTDETWISISGLSENFIPALILAEKIMKDAVPDPVALQNLITDILKERNDAKANQQANFRALISYAVFGSESPQKYYLTEQELKEIKPEILVSKIKQLSAFPHRILYYGPENTKNLLAGLNKHHVVAKRMLQVPEPVQFEELPTAKNTVYFSEYNANQSYVQLVMKSFPFRKDLLPLVEMFNAYFGGSMNAIVFQEMREKRSLAYTARSNFSTPSRKDKHFINNAFIATQNDKVPDALEAFNLLFDDMPLSAGSFELAKSGILNRIEIERLTKMRIVWTYLNNEKLGISNDFRKEVYEGVQKIQLNDVKAFADQYLKNQPKTYIILGREKDIDFDALNLYAPARKLTQEEIFGF
jgi:predicted Zn-dependent peptidase